MDNIPGNPYFMYSSFYQLDSFQLQEFFKKMGLELKVERGKRVFPVSDRSLDVVLALEKYLKQNKVKLHLESPVDAVLMEDGKAVVRPLTAEDVDRLGPACLANVFGAV